MDLPARSRLVLLACFTFVSVPDPAWGDPNEQIKLLPSAGAVYDGFGISIAVSGDTMVVGAANDDTPTGQQDAGAAYVFVRSGASWSEQAKLVASDANTFDSFGNSVAISGDTAVVGAWGYHRSVGWYEGAAYVYVRHGSSWSQQAKLLASDAQPYDCFGWSVAISGDTIIVGAYGRNDYSGRAYIFVRSGSTWTEQASLLASDAPGRSRFGQSVAISGDTAVVGANGYNGGAYIFVRSGSSWTEQAKLIASDGQKGDSFGWSVAISGDTSVVGADRADNLTGAGYVFVRNGSSWSEQAKLLASDGQPTDLCCGLGWSVAISGDLAVLGARDYDNLTGAAYVFVRSGTSWLEHAKLVASDAWPSSRFGFSVALADGTAVVGALVGAGLGLGAAYVFPSAGPGVRVNPATSLTSEGGGEAVSAVVLNTQPAGDVVIDLVSSDPGEGTVSPSQLLFTPDDWSTPQTFTLTGVDDLVDDNGQLYAVALTTNTELTEDVVYDGIDPPDVAAANLELAGDFYTLAPCRVLDTRLPDQAPVLTGGVERVVMFHGACGVPATARAVAINITVAGSTGAGHLTLSPGDLPRSGVSTFPFDAWQSRAKDAIVLLAADGTGTLTVSPFVTSWGTAHLILDVSGYFE